MNRTSEVFPANAELIHDEARVREAYQTLADAISRDFQDTNPVMLVVLMGGLIPAGQLLPLLNFPFTLATVHATRYRGDTLGGELHWLARPSCDLKGRDVLLVDDILDEGHTLKALVNHCEEAGARRVSTSVLVRKQRSSPPAVQVDYFGLEVPDRYVFGCGMDLHEYHRQWPAIYAVPETDP